MGTHQSQKALNGYGDSTKSMEEEGQVLEIGGSYAATGNGGKIGDTNYYHWGELGHHI